MQRSATRVGFLVALVVVGCAAALATGCGPRVLEHGVLLWGREASPANGTVLGVIGRSGISKTVTLWDRSSRTRSTTEEWRVRGYSRQAEAEAFASAYAPYRDRYAFTSRSSGIPLRENADTKSGIVYKIAPGQLLKVLHRSEEKATEGSLEDYWYEVLTDDGYTGFCFGYYLRSFESPRAEAQSSMLKLAAEDPVLDKLLSDAWRPEYFADMQKSGRVDLTRFTEDIGLFPDRQASEWKLVLRDFSATFSFDRAENPGPGIYTFPPSDLRIVVHPGDRLEVTYIRDGRMTRSVFVQIDGDIAEIIEGERERRRDILDTFLGRGDVLRSTAYGTIRIRDDGAFTWSGFDRVPSGVFLRSVSGAGTVDFACSLAASLQGSYQGAVSFVFDEYRNGEQTVFVYSFVSGGVQLTRIAPADVEDLEVKRVGASPLVMYFTFQAP